MGIKPNWGASLQTLGQGIQQMAQQRYAQELAQYNQQQDWARQDERDLAEREWTMEKIAEQEALRLQRETDLLNLKDPLISADQRWVPSGLGFSGLEQLVPPQLTMLQGTGNLRMSGAQDLLGESIRDARARAAAEAQLGRDAEREAARQRAAELAFERSLMLLGERDRYADGNRTDPATRATKVDPQVRINARTFGGYQDASGKYTPGFLHDPQAFPGNEWGNIASAFEDSVTGSGWPNATETYAAARDDVLSGVDVPMMHQLDSDFASATEGWEKELGPGKKWTGNYVKKNALFGLSGIKPLDQLREDESNPYSKFVVDVIEPALSKGLVDGVGNPVVEFNSIKSWLSKRKMSLETLLTGLSAEAQANAQRYMATQAAPLRPDMGMAAPQMPSAVADDDSLLSAIGL